MDNGKNHSDLKTAGSNPVCLNDDLNSLINQNSSTSIIVHENTDNVNSIIVMVPKDFNKEHLKYDYFKEINGRIILKPGINRKYLKKDCFMEINEKQFQR